MNQVRKINNKAMYIILVIIVVGIISLFGYFISMFRKYDKNEYEALASSILFDKDFNYIKVQEKASLKQRYDGNYYLYENKDKQDYKYKIGKTAVIYHINDNYIHLYGNVYQIEEKGEVIAHTGETKIAKTSPTKFFKLADRKYLMVDSEIRSINDKTIDTKDYLIIELDKQGNATFANNELNFKALKPIILTGSTFNFDIANEKLTYDDEVIDLKNVIGSTNEYKKNNKNPKTNSVIGGDGSSGEKSDYYDDYLNDVINSVNNLSGSVEKVNEKAKTRISSNGLYYDVNKWIALKKVTPSVSSITLEYTIFDPGSEYQAVFAVVKNNEGITNTIYVNKNDTEYTIRDLAPDQEYEIEFCYQTNESSNVEVVDEVKVKTKKPSYNIAIDKIKESYVDIDGERKTQYSIYFTLTADQNYVLKSGELSYYRNNILMETKTISGYDFNAEKQYSGVFTLEPDTALGEYNSIRLENMEVCDGESEISCNKNINLNIGYNFYGE